MAARSGSRPTQPSDGDAFPEQSTRCLEGEPEEGGDKEAPRGEQQPQEEAAETQQKQIGFLGVLCAHPLFTSLLLFVPLGVVSHFLHWPDWLTFVFTFLSILPMAWLIGKSTEDLACYTGPSAGGLLNATFGNVVEMLLCVAGIRQNQISVVQCTLVGSILSNMLLVLGTAFLYGGYMNPPPKRMVYSMVGACAQSSLMLLAVMGLILPTMSSLLTHEEQEVLNISRGASILLLFTYVQYLIFQLKTHKGALVVATDEEDEQPDMGMATSTAVLAGTTILTSICSDFLIDSVEGFVDRWQVSKAFVGVVLLPIIGNAAEHYTAIVVAGQNKMDLSLGVALGSSVQMALFVTPLTVLVGWVFDKPMSLDFHPFQVTVLLLAVLIVGDVLKDAESNWLEGSMLVCSYCTVAMIYLIEYDGSRELTA